MTEATNNLPMDIAFDEEPTGFGFADSSSGFEASVEGFGAPASPPLFASGGGFCDASGFGGSTDFGASGGFAAEDDSGFRPAPPPKPLPPSPSSSM